MSEHADEQSQKSNITPLIFAFLVVPIFYLLFSGKGYIDQTLYAVFWGEEVTCMPVRESESKVFHGRRSSDIPLYLTKQENDKLIISTQKLEVGIKYQCISAKDVYFIYKNESGFSFVMEYDVTNNSFVIVLCYLMLPFGVVSLLWYIVVWFREKQIN